MRASDLLTGSACHLEQLRASLTMPLAVAMASARSEWVLPGPEVIVVLGVDVPALSAAFGVVGVVLGQLLAPPAELTLRRRVALSASLLGIVVAIVIASGQIPLVAMGWGIGLGFSGLSVATTLGEQAKAGIQRITDAFFNMVAARMGQPKTQSEKTDG